MAPVLIEPVQAELEELLQAQRSRRDVKGRWAVVRNGYLQEHRSQTDIGSIPVSVPKVRDRSGAGIKFVQRHPCPACCTRWESRGLPGKRQLCALANKLARVIYGCVKSQQAPHFGMLPEVR